MVSTQSDTSVTSIISCPDRKARKKDQNRRAALNYRRKKMEEKNRLHEEEMRLVYSRVCLIGYAEELEDSILYTLRTKARTVQDSDGKYICSLCPICSQPCDDIDILRNHINVRHYQHQIQQQQQQQQQQSPQQSQQQTNNKPINVI